MQEQKMNSLAGGKKARHQVADLILKDHDTIVKKWRDKVIRDSEITQAENLAELRNEPFIERFIKHVVDYLKNESVENFSDPLHLRDFAQSTEIVRHAHERIAKGYALREALREISYIRSSISETCSFEGVQSEANYLVNVLIDASIVSLAEEIASREKAEHDARRRLEERLRIFINTVPDHAFFTMDAYLTIVDWNPAAERILGYSEEDVVGQHFSLIFTPEDKAARAPELERDSALKNGQGRDVRWHMRKDGSRFWANGLIIPLRDDNKTVIGFAKILKDETAVKKSQDEREKLLRELKQANKMKDIFIATLSHELRNPLGVISGYAEMLHEDGVPDPDLYKEAIGAIYRNTKLQNQLVSDLLDVSRGLSGKLTVDLRPVSLMPVVEAAIASVRRSAVDKGLELQFNLDPYAGRVMADTSRMQQVLWNLLTNCIKFTPKGGVIIIDLNRIGREVEIVIQDTGKGIDEMFLPFVFDRFRQEDHEAVKNQGGLGLGMAIVKQLVDLHKGKISVYSKGEGHGTKFTLKFPVAS